MTSIGSYVNPGKKDGLFHHPTLNRLSLASTLYHICDAEYQLYNGSCIVMSTTSIQGYDLSAMVHNSSRANCLYIHTALQ